MFEDHRERNSDLPFQNNVEVVVYEDEGVSYCSNQGSLEGSVSDRSCSDWHMELWADEGLGYVASLIGEPLNMDEANRARTQLSFAKICVVVLVDYSFKTSIPVKMGEKVIDLQLEYPWIPVSCSNCKLYGHKANNCPAKPKQVWRVKDNLNTKKKVTEIINEEVAVEEDTSTEEGLHYAECDENSSLDSLNTESCHSGEREMESGEGWAEKKMDRSGSGLVNFIIF
ncbi:hypothetical protein IFM89_011537 [Coptis chinensis]|uniref:DUF4283 domain-containing protein n=1 Tax=Coptis chinensis TaxID=261450 RepID=A0A835IW48_9MAGN|nr:hypothetical protein IFM89_011537 [Coptis chinensis]